MRSCIDNTLSEALRQSKCSISKRLVHIYILQYSAIFYIDVKLVSLSFELLEGLELFLDVTC